MSDENTYELIGRATVAWSDVELTWYLIYLTLSSASRDDAYAIYFAPKNAETERKITHKLGSVVLVNAKTPNTLPIELAKLYKRTNTASADRNNIAHGKFVRSNGKNDTSTTLWAVGKNGLLGKPLDSELSQMEKKFYLLADELMDF